MHFVMSIFKAHPKVRPEGELNYQICRPVNIIQNRHSSPISRNPLNAYPNSMVISRSAKTLGGSAKCSSGFNSGNSCKKKKHKTTGITRRVKFHLLRFLSRTNPPLVFSADAPSTFPTGTLPNRQEIDFNTL